MKKSLLILLIILTMLISSAALADDLSDIMQNGVLRMGSSPEYAPFVFYDGEGKMTGIDVALIEEVGRRMGIRVQTVDIAFDGLIDSLQIGQVDIIGRGLSVTDSRKEKIDFTRVYYKGKAQFIAMASLPKPASVDNSIFMGKKIGVQKATSFEQWIRENLISGGFVELKDVFLYANAADLIKALERGNVDLIVLDQDVYDELYKSSGKYQVFYDGFMEENYAFGLRKGSTLTSVINGHLLDMMRDGTAQEIADRFFSMDFTNSEAVITHPTAAPTAAPIIPVILPTQTPVAQCINSMTFTADVTITDGHQVAPGEHFRKIWRVYNNGTCTWNSGYSFVYVSGDQMSGNNISIPSTVAPGQTIDLAVDLIAPNNSGTYKGYWQMRSPQGLNFGETIWVKVRVPGNEPVYPTAVPTPTPEEGQHFIPINISSFYADSYEGYPENCVNIYWSASGASSVEITVDGLSVYRGNAVNGSRQICDQVKEFGSHEIQLHALNVVTDSWSSFIYTTMKHPTGLIVPDFPEEEDDESYATGLIIPDGSW